MGNVKAKVEFLNDRVETLENRESVSAEQVKVIQYLTDIPAAEHLTSSTARTRSAHTKKLRQFST